MQPRQPSTDHGRGNIADHNHEPETGPAAADSFAPPISHEDIFHRLIADEIRNGRLTRARRKRIVRYAAQLRLSAVEVGRMIEAARRQTLQSPDPIERRHALKLVEPPPERIPLAYKLSAVVLAAILVDLVIVMCL